MVHPPNRAQLGFEMHNVVVVYIFPNGPTNWCTGVWVVGALHTVYHSRAKNHNIHHIR